MTKRILLALTVAAALLIGIGLPATAFAERGHRHRGHHHHHHGHHRHGHWHHGHGHWYGHYRPIVYPPIYVGSYYPVHTYYGLPYYSYYGGYYPYTGYYRSGVGVYVGW